MTYQTFIPATGKLVESFDELNGKQLEDKLATAAMATWSSAPSPPNTRIQSHASLPCDGRLGDLLDKNGTPPEQFSAGFKIVEGIN
jgi:hypothetical protein